MDDVLNIEYVINYASSLLSTFGRGFGWGKMYLESTVRDKTVQMFVEVGLFLE